MTLVSLLHVSTRTNGTHGHSQTHNCLHLLLLFPQVRFRTFYHAVLKSNTLLLSVCQFGSFSVLPQITQLSKCYLPPPGHLLYSSTSLRMISLLGMSKKYTSKQNLKRNIVNVSIINEFTI